MTVGPEPAGRSARVAEEPEAQPEATLRPGRHPDRLGPVHVAQLLIAETVVVSVLAVVGRSALVVIIAAVVGLLLLAILLGRRQGRWLLERMLLRLRQRRRAAGTGANGSDPRMTALRSLAPGLDITDVETSDGVRVGVARDDAGWYAVAVVTGPSTMGGDARAELPLETMVNVLSEAEQPGAVLQVVTHTIPTPGLLDPLPSVPANQSYRELVARFGHVPVPLDQTTWVAVRLDSRTLAELGVEPGARLDAAPAIVAALIRRVGKSLARAGLSASVLDATGLTGALARSCDLEEAAHGVPGPREEWSAWHSPRLAHRAFWVQDWPPVTHAASLLEWLTTVPAAMSSLALVLTPDRGEREINLRCLVRVAAPAGELERLCQGVTEGARRAGADLFPLDGEQGPAVYASAPTGGGPR